jgi:hypothetical protein
VQRTRPGRVHVAERLPEESAIAAEGPGNHLLLRLTCRSHRCRSGSEIQRAGLQLRQSVEGRRRSVESCRFLATRNASRCTSQLRGLPEPRRPSPPRTSAPVLRPSSKFDWTAASGMIAACTHRCRQHTGHEHDPTHVVNDQHSGSSFRGFAFGALFTQQDSRSPTPAGRPAECVARVEHLDRKTHMNSRITTDLDLQFPLA